MKTIGPVMTFLMTLLGLLVSMVSAVSEPQAVRAWISAAMESSTLLERLTSPLFLTSFSITVCCGIYWVHKLWMWRRHVSNERRHIKLGDGNPIEVYAQKTADGVIISADLVLRNRSLSALSVSIPSAEVRLAKDLAASPLPATATIAAGQFHRIPLGRDRSYDGKASAPLSVKVKLKFPQGVLTAYIVAQADLSKAGTTRKQVPLAIKRNKIKYRKS